MDSSKLVKFAFGVVFAMALLASFVSSFSAAPDTNIEAASVVSDEVVTVDETVEIEPAIRSTRREKEPVMSQPSKETRARLDDEKERRPPNWGDRGMPPTDSVSTKVIKERTNRSRD